MQRSTLEAILARAPGLARDADSAKTRFVLTDGNDLTLYLGRPGSGMALQNVIAIELLETHIEVEVKDRGTLLTGYEAVQAALAGTRKERSARGGVGF
jgi:hypothetical protein